jgi:3-hydroxybutyryl-CoA dehydrogenase
LVPLLTAAQNYFFSGVSDVESIDKTWMITMGTKGAFWYSGQDGDANGLQCKYALGNKTGRSKDLIVPLSLNQILSIRVKWGK